MKLTKENSDLLVKELDGINLYFIELVIMTFVEILLDEFLVFGISEVRFFFWFDRQSDLLCYDIANLWDFMI